MGLHLGSAKSAVLALMLAFTVICEASAQNSADDAWREAPPSSTGIAVGKQIPVFSIPDQTGRPRDFKSIVGPNGAMIVFQRSVDW
jgi:hypothetical protein